MKYIFSLVMVLSVALLFTGCEKDSNGRMPDNIQDSNVGVVKLAPTSDYLIDRNDFAGFNFDIVVDALFDVPFQKITLMGVYNGDYDHPVMVQEVTSVPTTVSLTVDDLLSLFNIPVQDSIVIGDAFDFYTDITMPDGQTIPAYDPYPDNTAASSVRNVMAVLKNSFVSVHLPVPCPFVPEDFTGDAVDVLEHWNDNSGDAFYPASVSINTELSTEDVLVYDFVGLFTGDNTSHYRLLINKKTYQITTTGVPEDDIVVKEDLFGWGYGRLWFDDFTEPLLGTCEGYIRFTVTPDLNDTGLWFGSTVTYYIGPGAGSVTFDKKAPAREPGYDVLRDKVVKK